MNELHPAFSPPDGRHARRFGTRARTSAAAAPAELGLGFARSQWPPARIDPLFRSSAQKFTLRRKNKRLACPLLPPYSNFFRPCFSGLYLMG
jgi:hypothetical protein